MPDEIDKLLWGSNTTTPTVTPMQTQEMSMPKSVDDFFEGSNVQVVEQETEQKMKPILDGLPDGGRILQDTNSGKLFFTSKGYSTSNQDEIKSIIDNIRKGESVAPTQEAISRSKQSFFEEKAPTQVAEYYGIPEEVAKPATRAGLLSQQFLSGGAGLGSYFDEALTSSPQEKQRYERLRKDFESEYPVQSTASQIGGLATSMVGGSQAFGGAVDKFKKLANVVNKTKNWYQSLPPLGQKSAQVGGTTAGAGIEGLIYGAGQGDTSDERTINALQQGGMNAVITAPIATAFPIIGSVINRFKPVQQQIDSIATEFGIGVEAARLLKEAFESGMSLSDMITQVERSGSEKMMVDATVAFERLLDASKTSSAGATQKVDSAVTGRVNRESDQLRSDLDRTLGVQPEGTQTILERVTKGTAPARSDAYAKAYDHVIDFQSNVGQKIKKVLNRVSPDEMKKAIKTANNLLRDKGLPQFQILAKFDNQGNLTINKDINFIQLDYIKRGLDKLGGEVDNIGQPTGNAVLARGQASDLRNALVESNPAYGEALALGQGKIKTQQAIVLGSKILNLRTSIDEVKNLVKNASKDELAGARQGIREQIENIMSNAKVASGQGTAQETKEAMTAVTAMSSRANQDKLRLVLGEKTANAMFKRLDQVKKALEVQTGVRLGSPTAPREQIVKSVEEMIKGGSLKSFFSGDPKTAIAKMRDFLTGTGEEYYASRSAEIFDDITNILTSSKINGKSVTQALEYLQKVSSGETLTKPQANFVTKMIKNALESQGFAFGAGVEAQRLGLEQ